MKIVNDSQGCNTAADGKTEDSKSRQYEATDKKIIKTWCSLVF